MTGFFITATDTGVGKTAFTAALSRYLTDRSIDVRPCKPVETGVDILPPGTSDGERLREAAGSEASLEQISPWRLPEPLAPDLSIKRNGITVCYTDLLKQIRHQISGGLGLVEGAGGLLVPLCENKTILNLAADLALPLIVVIRPDLGTLNHSLLTFTVAKNAGLSLAGYVINRMPKDPGPAEASVVPMLDDYCDVPCLAVLPNINGSFEEQRDQLVDNLRHAPQCDALRTLIEGYVR